MHARWHTDKLTHAHTHTHKQRERTRMQCNSHSLNHEKSSSFSWSYTMASAQTTTNSIYLWGWWWQQNWNKNLLSDVTKIRLVVRCFFVFSNRLVPFYTVDFQVRSTASPTWSSSYKFAIVCAQPCLNFSLQPAATDFGLKRQLESYLRVYSVRQTSDYLF